jgi:hypothetical protein
MANVMGVEVLVIMLLLLLRALLQLGHGVGCLHPAAVVLATGSGGLPPAILLCLLRTLLQL